MRVPPFERYQRFTQAISVFILGTIAGAVLYNGIFHAHFDALVSLNGELESRLEQYEQDLRHLHRFRDQHTVIKSIQPFIEENRSAAETDAPPLDARTVAELKRRIKKDLLVLSGRSIYDIDSEARLVRILLDRKVYRGIFERDYDVEIKTMLVIDNILKVWVNVSPHNPG
jgi:hypothetical protein